MFPKPTYTNMTTQAPRTPEYGTKSLHNHVGVYVRMCALFCMSSAWPKGSQRSLAAGEALRVSTGRKRSLGGLYGRRRSLANEALLFKGAALMAGEAWPMLAYNDINSLAGEALQVKRGG